MSEDKAKDVKDTEDAENGSPEAETGVTDFGPFDTDASNNEEINAYTDPDDLSEAELEELTSPDDNPDEADVDASAQKLNGVALLCGAVAGVLALGALITLIVHHSHKKHKREASLAGAASRMATRVGDAHARHMDELQDHVELLRNHTKDFKDHVDLMRDHADGLKQYAGAVRDHVRDFAGSMNPAQVTQNADVREAVSNVGDTLRQLPGNVRDVAVSVKDALTD